MIHFKVNTTLLSITVVSLYLFSAYSVWYATVNSKQKFHLFSSIALLSGWIIQAWALHLQIDTRQGQNLSMSHLAAIVSWLMLAIVGISHYKHKVTLLLILILVNAVLFLIISAWFPSSRVFSLSTNPNALIHILSSLLAYSILALAALMAIWIWWLDSRLKNHLGLSNPLVPPLLGMEKLLFQLLTIGFIIFSFSILYALFFLNNEIWQQPLHKLILSFASWVVFGLLLIGHIRFGWRGKQAASWTLSAFLMLALAYFGVWAVKLWVIGG